MELCNYLFELASFFIFTFFGGLLILIGQEDLLTPAMTQFAELATACDMLPF